MITCCSIKTKQLPGDGTSLLIEGAATFEHEQELYRVILAALKCSDYLEISCGSILQADYSFVMLICAAHRTAEFLGRRLTIREGLHKGVLRHFEHARLSREDGCIYKPVERCLFWESLSHAEVDEYQADDTEEFPVCDVEPAETAPAAMVARQRGSVAIRP